MTHLDEFASNDEYTQFGEAGIIKHIFDKIGTRSQIAVEFGAGDGFSCSNTARLWKDEGWKAVLIESDPERFAVLESRAAPFMPNICKKMAITPTGPNSIGQLLTDNQITEVDFMSIDVDGDDYQIFAELTCRPRVICIEYNPTIPPHIELRQTALGDGFGASLLAMIRLGGVKGYKFVGANYCNAFFVEASESAPFVDYEVDPNVLFPPNRYTYAITDFGGRAVLCGEMLPWGVREAYVKPLAATYGYVTPITDDVLYLKRGFETVWGPAHWLQVGGLAKEDLVGVLNTNVPLVCIDLTQGSFPAIDLIWIGSQAPQYKALQVGNVLAFIKENP